MIYLAALAIAVGLGLPIAVLSAAMGQSKAAAAALEGASRQPELQGKLQTMMILAMAFIESLVLFTLLVFIVLQGRLPSSEAILQVLAGGA